MVCLPISRLPDIESVCWGWETVLRRIFCFRRKETAGTSAHNILLGRPSVPTMQRRFNPARRRARIHGAVYLRVILYPLCKVRREEGGCDVRWPWNGSLSSLRFVTCQRPLYATIQIDEMDELIHIAMFYQRTSPGTATERRSSRTGQDRKRSHGCFRVIVMTSESRRRWDVGRGIAHWGKIEHTHSHTFRCCMWRCPKVQGSGKSVRHHSGD